MYSSLPRVKSKHRLPGERGERVDICFFRLSLFLSVELRSAINVAEERLCKHSCFFPPFRIIVTGISFPPRPRYLKPITADPFGQNHIFIRIAKPLQSCVCACAFHVPSLYWMCKFVSFCSFFLPSQSLEIDINIKYVPECLVIYAPARVLLELLALRNVMHCAVYRMCALMDGSLHYLCTATKLIGRRKEKQSKQLPAVQQNFSGCFAFVESGKHLICLCVAFWVFLHKGEYQRYNTVLSLIRNVFAALQDQDRLTILLETLKK